MEFTIFIWLVVSFCFILYGVIFNIGTMIFSTYQVKRVRYLYLIGLPVLSVILYYYLPNSIQFWVELNKIVFPLLQTSTPNQSLLSEVWYTVVFFRNLWPSLVVSLIMIAMESAVNPMTSRHRQMHSFNHNKLLIMVISLCLYYVAYYMRVGGVLAVYFLAIAFYTAVYYWRFGYATILYIFKKNNIPYEVGAALLIGSIIFAQEYFMVSLVVCIGFGISDIWMDYHKRDAASMVFSIDFNK